MSNIADLKAALIVEAEKLTDTIDKAQCLSLIDSWYTAQVAVDALASNKISSYSMGGISVTRHQLPSLRQDVQATYAEILTMIGRGGGGLVSTQYAQEGRHASSTW